MSSALDILTGHALRQHGCFTRAQARAAGLSASAIDRRLRSGEWLPVDHGVYRSATTPQSWHQRLLAACLAGPAVASHRSAAALWEVPGFDVGIVEVTARRHRRRTSPDVCWHESRHLDRHDVTEVDGIPTTDPRRTLIDLGALLDAGGLLVVLDDLLRRRLVSEGGVRLRVAQLGPHRRGAANVRRALDRRPAGTATPESVLESEFDLLLRRFGLPEPTRQYVVYDGDEFVARLDHAYEWVKVNMEVDGARWHASPDARARDAARDARLAHLGWLVLRFTAADIRMRPAWVAEQIRLALFERTQLTIRR